MRTKGETDEMIQTKKPTLLIFNAICWPHRAKFDLSYWITKKQWHEMKMEAEAKGFRFPEMAMAHVEFKPLNWKPHNIYMEMDRG